MLFKYTFPVTTSLVLTEHWPILVEGLRFEWHAENGLVTAVSVIVPMATTDRLPSVAPSEEKGVAWEINMGDSPHIDRVENALRTVQGLLHLFSSIEIHFDQYEAGWVPESKNEGDHLKLLSYSRKAFTTNPDEPRRLSYDLVARIVASTNSAASFEIPLNFLRRGNRDIHAGRYIEAFYNLFFFLETLYAPGFSDPKKVKQKLCAAPEVTQALAPTRIQLLQSGCEDKAGVRMRELFSLNDDDLIGHLVDLRGNLHHHALRRPGIWHPDKPDEFRAEVLILQQIAHEISMAEMMPILFSEERDRELLNSAKNSGSILKLRVETVVDKEGIQQRAAPVIFQIPGQKITKEIINHINYELHGRFPGGAEGGELREFKITSDDGKHVYGIYERP